MDRLNSFVELLIIDKNVGFNETNPGTDTIYRFLAKILNNTNALTQYWGKALWGIGGSLNGGSAPDKNWYLGASHEINLPYSSYLDQTTYWLNFKAYTTDSDYAAQIKILLKFYDPSDTCVETIEDGPYGTLSTTWDNIIFYGTIPKIDTTIAKVTLEWYVLWNYEPGGGGGSGGSTSPYEPPPPASSTAYAKEADKGGVITFRLRRYV